MPTDIPAPDPVGSGTTSGLEDEELDGSFDPSPVGLCSEFCDQRICDARGRREECSSNTGSCKPVVGQCSRVVPCKDAANDFCEARICWPRTGECNANQSCPPGSECQDSVCRLKGLEDGLSALMADRRISVPARVRAGLVFSETADVRFEWNKVNEAVFVAVLDEPESGWSTASIDELVARVTWEGVPKRGGSSIEWRQGESYDGRRWISPPLDPARNTTLYYAVLATKDGKLVAASAPTPFRVGSAWADIGADCSDDATICGHPSRPLVCRDGTCELRCASHRDCENADLRECGDPEDGVRTCVRE